MGKNKKEMETFFIIYRSLFENNPSACYATDTYGNFVLFNDAAVSLLGYTEEEALEMNYLSIIAEKYRAGFSTNFHTILEGSKVMTEAVLTTKDKKEKKVYVTTVPIMRGKIIEGVIGIFQDITEQEKIQKDLAESKTQFQNILDSIDVCIWSWDIEAKRPTNISSASKQIFGYSSEEMLASPDLCEQVFYPGDKQVLDAKFANMERGIIKTYEYRVFHCSNGLKWVSDYSVPVLDENGKLIRIDGVIADIDKQKRAEEQLKYLAFHDPLTALPNRRMLLENLETAIKKRRPNNGKIALFYLDLDRFKYINDSLGHEKGDLLLQMVADRLRSCLDNKSTITRQGGDEFVILIEKLQSTEEVVATAKKILVAINQPFLIEPHQLTLTTSIGISIYPDHAQEANALLAKSDQAMYLAKEKGKSNFQLYQPGLHGELSRTMELEQGLHQAFKNKELELHYQPIINVKKGSIAGFEALARWNHPQWGWIPPCDFIPIAEASGLINRLGEWTLQTAVHQCEKWNAAGYPVYVTVNVSSKQLENDNFIVYLKETLKASKLNPSSLKLELTESTAMDKAEDKIIKLWEIEKLGIDILLDDFGTGYSSLSYLKKFPITTLKIDKSFVAEIKKSTNEETIICAIIALAESLHIKVVAEGVEDYNQLYFLAQQGCSLMQGYYFNRPVPVVEVENLLKEDKKYKSELPAYSEI